MSKIIAIVLALSGAGYYYFVLGSQVSERDAQNYFTAYYDKLDAGDDKALCDMYADSYVERGIVVRTAGMGGTAPAEANKEAACAFLRGLIEGMKKQSEKLGMPVVTNTQTVIEDVAISPNKKSAVVTGKFELKIGTEQRLFMKQNTQAKITLIKQGGKVLATNSDYTSTQIQYRE
ncbi:MAG: hypothetical protein EAZ37_05945 [Burkholderiales bacterium]|nr:MAG: hypothetical protein EAZ37_05945 [Burkholderiales bacterium]